MPDIFFQDVSKTYGKEAALRGVTVAFVDGVTTAVIGPSIIAATKLSECDRHEAREHFRKALAIPFFSRIIGYE